MLVPDTGWLQSSNASYHTGTSFLSFTCSVCNSKASMQCAYKESTQIALIFAFFRSLMRGGWGRRNSVAPQAGSAALGITVLTCTRKNGLMSSFWSQEIPYISSVSSLVSCVPQRSCESGKNAISSPFAQIVLMLFVFLRLMLKARGLTKSST